MSDFRTGAPLSPSALKAVIDGALRSEWRSCRKPEGFVERRIERGMGGARARASDAELARQAAARAATLVRPAPA